jgi:hypothetical protein
VLSQKEPKTSSYRVYPTPFQSLTYISCFTDFVYDCGVFSVHFKHFKCPTICNTCTFTMSIVFVSNNLFAFQFVSPPCTESGCYFGLILAMFSNKMCIVVEQGEIGFRLGYRSTLTSTLDGTNVVSCINWIDSDWIADYGQQTIEMIIGQRGNSMQCKINIYFKVFSTQSVYASELPVVFCTTSLY